MNNCEINGALSLVTYRQMFGYLPQVKQSSNCLTMAAFFPRALPPAYIDSPTVELSAVSRSYVDMGSPSKSLSLNRHFAILLVTLCVLVSVSNSFYQRRSTRYSRKLHRLGQVPTVADNSNRRYAVRSHVTIPRGTSQRESRPGTSIRPAYAKPKYVRPHRLRVQPSPNHRHRTLLRQNRPTYPTVVQSLHYPTNLISVSRNHATVPRHKLTSATRQRGRSGVHSGKSSHVSSQKYSRRPVYPYAVRIGIPVSPTLVRAPFRKEAYVIDSEVNYTPQSRTNRHRYQLPTNVARVAPQTTNTNEFDTVVAPPGFRITFRNATQPPKTIPNIRGPTTSVVRTSSVEPSDLIDAENTVASTTYNPTRPSSTAVLRIRTTSISEAKNLIANIGRGFKVRFVETPTNATEVETNKIDPQSSRNESERFTASRRDTSGHTPNWWKGKHVCTDETPGLYGVSGEIMKRIRIVENCVEEDSLYICTKRYGSGLRAPRKTVIHKCCLGYFINSKRTACKLGQITGQTGNAGSSGSTWVSRLTHTEALGGRRQVQVVPQILTIFMPNDDVVVRALTLQNGSDEGTQVEKFLENHVIPDRKLLSTNMENNELFQAVSGNQMRVNFFPSDIEDIMTVNCRKVSGRDVVSDNSVVHFIDDVMDQVTGTIYDVIASQPEKFSTLLSILRNAGLKERLQSRNVSLTLFAPTNEAFEQTTINTESGACLNALARNHLLSHVFCTPSIEVYSQKHITMHAENLTIFQDDGIYVGSTEVITNDVMALNGVIHVIDGVLKPQTALSMLDVVESDNHLSTFVGMFDTADIKPALATGNNFTLIAPYNKAFKKMKKSERSSLIRDVERLRNVLMYHVIPQIVSINELQSRDKLETLNPPMTIHVTRYVRIRRIRVKGQRRVVRTRATSLQCSRVIKVPTPPCNGALFVVDKVLQPPSGSILATLMYSTKSNFSILITAIKITGLQPVLDGKRHFTFFAPSNDAFARISQPVLNRLFRKRQLLLRVLRFHLIPGFNCADKLSQRSLRHRTYRGGSVFTCPKRRGILLGRKRKRLRAKVTESDLEATNGVVHAINNLLLPRKFNLLH